LGTEKATPKSVLYLKQMPIIKKKKKKKKGHSS